MPYDPKHKPKTRIRILNAATALFKKHGFENVTIDQVMAAAGLTRGGFYAHFKNKEDLFVACVENGMSLLSSPVLAKLRKAELLGNDWVTSFAELYLSRLHIENPDMGCALPTLSTEVSRSGDKARTAFSKLINQASEKLAWKLAKEDAVPGIDRHINIDGDDKPRDVPESYEQEATAMLAMMVGAVVLSRAVDDDTADRILERTRDTILDARSKQIGEKDENVSESDVVDQSKKPVRTSA
ncbi:MULTISPECIES: TetR/AcrR family transcriptional regulator [Thalassospira]|uniref:TetR/AcrR family transcriptional regulator n=1 Tax=Thalassospira aquimaris TaxID=3037796 RepID=A0ABT6GAM8_9PROT|nr:MULTISPECIES: TetR/AcrR family transcriptional regulator [Thalassospira]MDG4718937.1 TetR/AcrR family transcriptional regulator [Thalassospira sp. FZY0004]